MWASINNHLHISKFLVEQGASIDAVDKYGSTALIWSSSEGHLEILRFFCDRGANVNALTNVGSTALLAACCRGHLFVARFLCERNADVNAADIVGYTALIWASKKGHLFRSRIPEGEQSQFYFESNPSALHRRLTLPIPLGYPSLQISGRTMMRVPRGTNRREARGPQPWWAPRATAWRSLCRARRDRAPRTPGLRPRGRTGDPPKRGGLERGEQQVGNKGIPPWWGPFVSGTAGGWGITRGGRRC